jgi:uncharacterized protein YukE
MPTLADDRAYFWSGVRELEDYLLSNELFWPLSAGSNLPRLTIGGLLLSQIRLRTRTSAMQAAGEVKQAERDMIQLRSRWRVAWERKAAQEVHARLARWQDYLTEDQRFLAQRMKDYPHEVQGRVILQILKQEAPGLSKAWATIEALDQLVKEAWLPGPFIWEMDLSGSFPAAEYWFLYGKLKSGE